MEPERRSSTGFVWFRARYRERVHEYGDDSPALDSFYSKAERIELDHGALGGNGACQAKYQPTDGVPPVVRQIGA